MTVSIRIKMAGFALYVLFALIIEFVTFRLLGFGLVPDHFVIDLSFLLMTGAFFLAMPSAWLQFFLEFLFLAIQIAISITNLNLQAITGETFLWEMLALVGAAEAALEGTSMLDFTSVMYYAPLLLLFLVVRIAVAILLKTPRLVEKQQRKLARRRAFLVTVVAAFACYGGGFLLKTIAYAELAQEVEGSTEEEILLSDAYLFETLMQGDAAIQTFGTFTYYVKTSYHYLGIEGDVDTTAMILDEWFAAGEPYVNDYTGISAGNNLIVILLESFEYFAIDYQLTPTLYRLFYQDGVWLGNYYAKNKTDVSEAYSIFGSYPARGSLFYNYLDDSFPFSLPNVIRANTDIAAIRSFHNNYGDFYNRSLAHLSFGFDEHVDAAMMDLTEYKFWIRSDEEMMEDQADEMIPDDGTPFYTFITSFVMHGGYNKRAMFRDTYEYFDDIGYRMEDTYYNGLIRTYMAAAMDLDRALAILFDRLEETDHLDDTTVVLFADHQAYYYGLNYHMRGIDPAVIENPELYRLPALIYDTKLKAYRSLRGLNAVSKFVTTYDFVPTILNLFGISYNPNLYVGFDIFSPEESVAISKTGGIFNDQFYTSDGVTELWRSPSATTEDWLAFQSLAARSMDRTNHLNLVYAIDYFSLRDEEE